jgi:hypothetical protein
MQDRFESEGISVVYCPKDEMLADKAPSGQFVPGILGRSSRSLPCEYAHKISAPPSEERVENPMLEKARSGVSGQTFALSTKKKVAEQMEVASAPTYA